MFRLITFVGLDVILQVLLEFEALSASAVRANVIFIRKLHSFILKL